MTETTPPTAAPDLVSDRSRLSPRMMLYAGIAGAAALGLILAVLLSGNDEPKADSQKGLAIAVQPAPKPTPIPVVKGDPVNGLPAEVATLPVNPQRPAAVAPPPEIVPASTEPVSQPKPRARPAFDCEDAGSRAEEMICADDRLAAADRRMDRLYQQALDAGVPQRILRRQQRDFLDAREEAARHGPDAVADVYSERIAELQGMTQGY